MSYKPVRSGERPIRPMLKPCIVISIFVKLRLSAFGTGTLRGIMGYRRSHFVSNQRLILKKWDVSYNSRASVQTFWLDPSNHVLSSEDPTGAVTARIGWLHCYVRGGGNVSQRWQLTETLLARLPRKTRSNADERRMQRRNARAHAQILDQTWPEW